MIQRSKSFDLGNDKTRMKDPRDAERQHATTDEILRRFFHNKRKKRYEIQLLADEVGMGKTFVALAVAYSILEAMRKGCGEPDLEGCYQRVLVITPQNQALFTKWTNEVGEFVKRCVIKDQNEARKTFKAARVERIDELVAELRKPGIQPDVLITNTGIFQGKMLLNYALKRQVMLGLLFRYWGNRFQYEYRWNLLKGAPDGWPINPDHLCELSQVEAEQLYFGIEEMYTALINIAGQNDIGNDAGSIEVMLSECRYIAQPYVREREHLFEKINSQLAELYKSVVAQLIKKTFPLVIVDEAHNWKNGPSSGTNGFWGFTCFVASKARRILLLTATPFQLRPEEMLEILKISDYIEPCATKICSWERRNILQKYREDVIRPVLNNASYSSKSFSREWARLPKHIKIDEITSYWNLKELLKCKNKLKQVADERGEIDQKVMSQIINESLRYVHPDSRPFLKEALRLMTYNRDLSRELGRLVIRHRRMTEHRLFKVGLEIDQDVRRIIQRGDSHILHLAPGMDVRGNGELPHYLLMRCVTEMKKAKGRRGRSSLGSALTGCYSTIHDSAEGREIKKWLQNFEIAQKYLNLLMDLVSEDQDPEHPKVKKIVDIALENWKQGEKTLIFCFRVNTAQRLRDIIDNRIRAELMDRQKNCLEGEHQFENLKSRLTGRERDLIAIGLDRVLLSLLVYIGSKKLPIPQMKKIWNFDESFFKELAEVALRYGIELTGDRIDRVFLFRAIEHIISKRIEPPSEWHDYLKSALKDIQNEEWITKPYRLSPRYREDDVIEDKPAFDERGVHFVYEMKKDLSEEKIKSYALRLIETREWALRTHQNPILDHYINFPSLWFGNEPLNVIENSHSNSELLNSIHLNLWSLTLNSENEIDWESRRKVFQALRRAVLRNSVLLRLLPEKTNLKESMWGELLIDAFYSALPGQNESMADRLSVFLEDLNAASGSLSKTSVEDGGARFVLYDATRLTDQQFVSLVKGGGGKENIRRNRVFSGFNTPLLPEVLVCTQVGQEGIDLHRHCRHVIHYDLAWNPAILEQRTGRADRIGSKTFRERAKALEELKPFLEIFVPFLAGTYDERMYEELRLRSQMFEVLTGGDLASDNREGLKGEEDDEGIEGLYAYMALPEKMAEELRVNLHWWGKSGQ